MNELLETERAYVEELLCVLEVGSSHISGWGLESSFLMNKRIYYLYSN